jgi:hypothetical protein
MTMNLVFNLVGLLLITCGSIGAALGTPSPQHNSDGSVSLSGVSDKEARIAMHHRQKWFPHFLMLVGIGAFLQAIALFI